VLFLQVSVFGIFMGFAQHQTIEPQLCKIIVEQQFTKKFNL